MQLKHTTSASTRLLLAATAVLGFSGSMRSTESGTGGPGEQAPARQAGATWTVRPHLRGGGVVVCPAEVEEGASATCTITPAPGFRVVEVTVDGVPVSDRDSYTFTRVSSHRSIAATFARS